MENQNSSPHVIVCFRASIPGMVPVQGSTKVPCDQCKQEVWVSPSSLKIQAERNALIGCSVCVVEKMTQNPGAPISFEPLSREQVQEIKESIESLKRRN